MRRAGWTLISLLAARSIGCAASGHVDGAATTRAPAPSSAPMGEIGARRPRAPQEVDTPSGPCRLRENGRLLSLSCHGKEGERLWGYDEASGGGRDAVIAADDLRVYVAWFSDIAAGCDLVAYDLRTGEILWHDPLVAMGPVDHSKYQNAVEIRLLPGRIRVLGWETAGKYVEDVDPMTGETLSSTTVDARPKRQNPSPQATPRPGSAEGVAFVFEGESPRRDRAIAVTTAEGATCEVGLDPDESETHLVCKKDGERLWAVDVAGQFFPGAAITTTGDHLFVATYCAVSSGAVVTAYDAARGRFLWTRRLYAVGPIGHSEYYNDVDLRVEKGTLVVSGWEAHAKYVEVLDATTGEDLGNRKEP